MFDRVRSIVCVCMCVCFYVYVYIYTCMRVCLILSICMYVCMYVCVCVCIGITARSFIFNDIERTITCMVTECEEINIKRSSYTYAYV